MIAQLTGRLADKQPNRLVVDVHGVGYELFVPLSTFYGLPDPGGEVALRVHTHVREDAIQLFGFLTSLEQEIFQRLIAVSGIGPRLALAILSGIEPHDLVRAVQAGDIARLTAIPGIGRKTAERISLELKDRMPALDGAGLGQASPAEPEVLMRHDLLSALANLGYQRHVAEKALDVVLKAAGPATFEHRLRQALRELAR